MQAIRLEETIEEDGKLILDGLPVFKGQHVELLLLYREPTRISSPDKAQPKKKLTARALLESDLIGLWADRTDILDSATYARELREQAQRRSA